MLFYVHSSIAIILIGKRELVALLNLSSWYLLMVECLFLAVPWGCLWFVFVVFPDQTHLLFCVLLLCLPLFSTVFHPILIILASNDGMHERSEDIEIRPDQTTDCGVSSLKRLKKISI